ncbi:MAG: hypothetical protein LUG88_07030 [Clostridia bacterium]|nr:hypothetical protein [Clostridia bacterium]
MVAKWLQRAKKEREKAFDNETFPSGTIENFIQKSTLFFSKNQAIIKKKHIKNPLVERKTPQLFHAQI